LLSTVSFLDTDGVLFQTYPPSLFVWTEDRVTPSALEADLLKEVPSDELSPFWVDLPFDELVPF